MGARTPGRHSVRPGDRDPGRRGSPLPEPSGNRPRCRRRLGLEQPVHPPSPAGRLHRGHAGRAPPAGQGAAGALDGTPRRGVPRPPWASLCSMAARACCDSTWSSRLTETASPRPPARRARISASRCRISAWPRRPSPRPLPVSTRSTAAASTRRAGAPRSPSTGPAITGESRPRPRRPPPSSSTACGNR